ncbi:MAG TPA: hypothetical protein EYH39_03675 [Desulfurobacteriaceae bacterium]|nr:hypothetical protein [Desulfurobacteriaceae bacterium]
MFFSKLKASISKIFSKGLSQKEFEKILIENGFSYRFIKEILKEKNFQEAFKKKLESLVNFSFSPEFFLNYNTFIFLGPNGSGKTSALVKFANYLSNHISKEKILLVAADTYRSAAFEQLELLAKKVNLKVYFEKLKPATLVYKALEKYQDNYIFIDTSGRLETNKNLLKELSNIFKVCKKFSRKILNIYILDATYGKHAINQIKEFKNYIPIDGLGITKFDISKKIGFIFEVIEILKLPIFFISYGENIKDISLFEKKSFLEPFLSFS